MPSNPYISCRSNTKQEYKCQIDALMISSVWLVSEVQGAAVMTCAFPLRYAVADTMVIHGVLCHGA